MEIHPGIHLLQYPCGTSWSGMILIIRKRIVLIDTAFEPAVASLLYPYLEKLRLQPENIDLIINTHVHGDHIGGNAKLQTETGAKLAVHETGVEKLRDPYRHLNAIRRRFFPLVPFQEISSGFVPLETDLVLHDGDRIDLGDTELQIVHTPGHDRESICIFDPDSGYLFSGDSLQGRGTLSAGLAFYQDLDAYRETLRCIEAMADKVKCLVAGHPFHPENGLMHGEKITEFLRCCRDTVSLYDRKLREMLKIHGHPDDLKFFTENLLQCAGLTVKPTVPVLPYYTVTAHLSKIRRKQLS
ncbi:MAG: MBL fold metallo-hydrolase [Victivallales bacterium]|nr:MBL fold metallo-hydrolase [Victivallales bacterium]